MYGIFATADGWIGIIGVPPEARDAFFIAMDKPELALDSRFQGLLASREDMQFLFAELTPAFQQKTTARWCEVLREMGVRYAPVRNYAQAAQDPGLWHNGYLQHVAAGDGQEAAVVGTPISMSATPLQPKAEAPGLGADTQQVLSDLGYSDAQIDSLRARSII
jgi:crotonobetainyl-CoA:carnitine CoA-transferase CaiB-like acyl-CoA transferase